MQNVMINVDGKSDGTGNMPQDAKPLIKNFGADAITTESKDPGHLTVPPTDICKEFHDVAAFMPFEKGIESR